MSPPVTVHLAWNDERGNFCKALFAVEFHDADGHLMTLDYDPVVGLPVDIEAAEDGSVVIVFGDGNVGERHHARARARWVGNMAWDAVRMTPEAAERLARYLVSCCLTVTEFVCAEPWESIAKEER